jgi:glycosyltransferase 2 family protein
MIKTTPSDTSPKKNRWLHPVLGIAVTALALWLTFRDISWPILWSSLRRIDPWWTLLAFIVPLIAVFMLGFRWRLLLDAQPPPTLRHLFRLNIIGQFANILMPARLGDVVRIYLGSRQMGLSAARITGTVVIEKGLDLIIFVALWAAVPPLLTLKEGLKGTGIALWLSLGVILIIALLTWQRGMVLKAARQAARLLPRRFRIRFVEILERGLEPFTLFRDTRKILILAGLTLIILLGTVLTNYILFRAFDLPLSFGAALVVFLALQIASLPPSVPGKVGIFQYAVILALGWFGVDKDIALAYGLVLHVAAFLPKIILGMIYVSRSDISLRAIKQPDQLDL